MNTINMNKSRIYKCLLLAIIVYIVAWFCVLLFFPEWEGLKVLGFLCFGPTLILYLLFRAEEKNKTKL